MPSRLAVHTLFVLLALLAIAATANTQASMAQEVPFDDEARPYCTEDAMIVFDASGSMAGNTVQGLFSDKSRIGEVRAALTPPFLLVLSYSSFPFLFLSSLLSLFLYCLFSSLF